MALNDRLQGESCRAYGRTGSNPPGRLMPERPFGVGSRAPPVKWQISEVLWPYASLPVELATANDYYHLWATVVVVVTTAGNFKSDQQIPAQLVSCTGLRTRCVIRPKKPANPIQRSHRFRCSPCQSFRFKNVTCAWSHWLKPRSAIG